MDRVIQRIEAFRRSDNNVGYSFDMTVVQMRSIYNASNDGFDIMSKSFMFDYMQGMRKAQATFGKEFRALYNLCLADYQTDLAEAQEQFGNSEIEWFYITQLAHWDKFLRLLFENRAVSHYLTAKPL